MSGLYPLKFNPIYVERIWGGNRFKTVLNKDTGDAANLGESWEISAVEGNISVVSNGFLQGNNLSELVEVYMGDLVGDKIYERFGAEFPLLIKYIDAEEDLSIQVHPNDELAKERHNAYGKTEMWYVVDADPGARINSGFVSGVTREKFEDSLSKGKLEELLHFDEALSGDVFFIPAGRVHAIGKGVLVAEIQQTSDVTYRIFDYDRTDIEGNPRELHMDLAMDAIEYSSQKEYKTNYESAPNQPAELAQCAYFTTNLLEFNQEVERDYHRLDSFTIYVSLSGTYDLVWEDGTERVSAGETVLVPASLERVTLKPLNENAKLLEVYINS